MVELGKASLTEKVYNQIKEMIVYGQLKSGETLTVGEMAEHFRVSKTPVRDAFNALKHDGLLEVLPYKGYLISQVNLKDLDELFTLRVLLEGGAAELAATHASGKSLEKLENLVNLNSRGELESETFFMKLNFDFHVAVAEASNNLRLIRLITNVLDQMQRVLYIDLKVGSTYSMNGEHQQLVWLIRDRDAAGAKKLMIEHINSTRNRIFARNFSINQGGADE